MKFLLEATSLALLITACFAQTTDYCDPALCPTGGPHIACNGLQSMSSSCGPGSYEDSLDDSLMAQIVNLHNSLRNRIALGQQNYTNDSYFEPAARMPTLEWNQELAEIAADNTRRCLFGQDFCRNTKTMHHVGQNIALYQFSGLNPSDEKLIDGFINGWFDEYSNANPSLISRFSVQGQTGLFTQIVSDRTNQIGCSLVTFFQSTWTVKYFVCNYGVSNIIGQPVYVSGPTATGCQTGTNSQYLGLCSTAEVVSNNI